MSDNTTTNNYKSENERPRDNIQRHRYNRVWLLETRIWIEIAVSGF
jgi:hypothetical protein